VLDVSQNNNLNVLFWENLNFSQFPRRLFDQIRTLATLHFVQKRSNRGDQIPIGVSMEYFCRFPSLISISIDVSCSLQSKRPLPRCFKNISTIILKCSCTDNAWPLFFSEGGSRVEVLKLSKFECPVQTSPIRVLPQFHRSSVLEVLMISNLSVTGKLVKNYDYLKRLKKLTLSQNRLVGEIPNWNFINISYIDLSNNDLNGTVPSSIFTASLDVLKASVNPGLAGQLPKLPKNMTCIDMRWTNISSLQFPAEYIEKVKVLLLPWPNFQGFSPHCKTVDATDFECKKFRLGRCFAQKYVQCLRGDNSTISVDCGEENAAGQLFE